MRCVAAVFGAGSLKALNPENYIGGPPGGAAEMTVTTPIPVKGRKIEQVLKGAREVFLRDGYQGASVDEIARASQVSKATLYSYFPDKRVMFLEVVKAECRSQAQRSARLIDHSPTIEQALRLAAQNLVAFLTSDFGISVYRICVGESDRFPELGREFYESGPKLVRDRIVAMMKQGIARGELVIDDVELAADQFAELCKAGIFPRVVCCNDGKPDPKAVARVVDGAIITFMARYGAPRATRTGG